MRAWGEAVSANVENDYTLVGTYDAVINHIFAAGLAVSAALNLHEVDNGVAERLQDALDVLDKAAIELRTAAFSHTFGDADAAAEPVEPSIPDGHRRLSRFTVNEIFAYGVGRDFRRAADHQLWAHESDDLLLSARSGTPLARRVGRVFYDIETGAPLYHDDGLCESTEL